MPTNKPEVVLPELPNPYSTATGFALYNVDQLRAYGQACIDTLTRPEMSPDFTDSARAAISWVLFHHQGRNSPVGQPLRFALGMGADDPLPEWRIAEAERYARWTRRSTNDFHKYSSQQSEAFSFVNQGDSEANFIADGEHLNCPACGGSGHVDDAQPQQPAEAVATGGDAPIAPVPYEKHEREILQVIDQRDRYHEVADELAGSIAALLGVEIGEHSSANSPWQNAIDAAASHAQLTPPPAIDIGKLRELVARWRQYGDNAALKAIGEAGAAVTGAFNDCADELAALIGDGGEKGNV